MKAIYNLNASEMPTIPVPHDCVISDILLEEDSLYFVFEDIFGYDSIKVICPDKNANSLIVKFHLLDNIYDIKMFMRDKRKVNVYNELEVAENSEVLLSLSKKRLEYLYHNVGYCSIIVKLWSERSIVLDLSADYVEFEWR